MIHFSPVKRMPGRGAPITGLRLPGAEPVKEQRTICAEHLKDLRVTHPGFPGLLSTKASSADG